MGVAWLQDRQRLEVRDHRQELHYLSSYRTREDAVLHVDSTSTDVVKERLFISDENTKLTPATLIDYLTGIIDSPNRPEDIAVFICGTPAYSQMVKDCCAIVSEGVKSYVW